MPLASPITDSSRRIAEQIARLIRRGEYKPGARLPPERDLARLLEVSRPSVREALIALEVEGYVEVRVGSGVEERDTIPLDYDPMVAKIVAFGRDRDEALRRMRRALNETRVEGIETSIPFFLALLDDPDVLSAAVSTQFLEAWKYASPASSDLAAEVALVAAAVAATRESLARRGSSQPRSPSAWRTARPTFGHRE